MATTKATYLACGDCGKLSPPGTTVKDTAAKAEAEGWVLGYHGYGVSNRKVPGWEDDYCPECATRHERIYCQGMKKSKNGIQVNAPCDSKARYRLVRETDGKVLLTCGRCLPIMERQFLLGAKKEEGIRVFLME